MKEKQIKYISPASELELSFVIPRQARYSKVHFKYIQLVLLEFLNKCQISASDKSTVTVRTVDFTTKRKLFIYNRMQSAIELAVLI